MTHVRVLLVELSGITGELVREIVAQHDDIEIVGTVIDADHRDGAASLAEVDLVITMHRPDQPDLRHLDRMLIAKPGLAALAIQHEGRSSVMYTLVPQTTPLGPLSPDALVEFIRSLPRLASTERFG